MPSSGFCEHLKKMWYTQAHTDIQRSLMEMAALCTQPHADRLGRTIQADKGKKKQKGPLAGVHPAQRDWIEKSEKRRIEDKFGEVTWDKPF